MNSKNFRLALILLAVMPILFIGCNRSQTPAEPVYDTIPLEPEPEPEPEVVIEEPAPKPAPAPDRPFAKNPKKRRFFISPATEPMAASGVTSP